MYEINQVSGKDSSAVFADCLKKQIQPSIIYLSPFSLSGSVRSIRNMSVLPL